MFFAKIDESDNEQFQNYQKLISMDQFVGFVDSKDFFAEQHVAYSIYAEDDQTDGMQLIYKGIFHKERASIEEDVTQKLRKLQKEGQAYEDIEPVAKAFALKLFAATKSERANATRAAPKPPWHQKKRFWIGFMAIVTLLCVVALVTVKIVSSSASQAPSVPSQAQLLEQKRYSTLEKHYPAAFSDYENQLTDKNDLQGLKQLQKAVPTNLDIPFDIAFLKRDWQAVIKHSDHSLNQPHKARLAIAYVYDQQPSQALALNTELQSQTLSQMVFLTLVHQGNFDEAEKVGKSLNHREVAKVLKAGKTYQSAYEKARDDAKNASLSSEKRQKAAINRDNFLKLRQSIGGLTKYESK